MRRNIKVTDMENVKIMPESVFTEENPFIIRNIGNDIVSQEPFRMKGAAILLCLGGRCVIRLNTLAYNIIPGSEAIIFPETTLLFTDASEDLDIAIFSCSSDMMSRALSKFSPDFFGHMYNSPVYQHPEGNAENTVAYFSILKRIYNDRRNRYRNMIATNILRSFMLDVYDKVQKYSLDENKELSVGRREEIYNEFMNLVYDHGLEHHDVAFYADRLCITTRYLASVTSAVARKSPKQAISEHLLQEIKIFLTFSELTLQQIADRLHFPDQSHLGRFFKQKTGMSPLAYRKKEMAM